MTEKETVWCDYSGKVPLEKSHDAVFKCPFCKQRLEIYALPIRKVAGLVDPDIKDGFEYRISQHRRST